ncbi:MAG TPA: hypothetical protein VFT74_00865 [Isosphaeraceae bacterium]|nr:hypothetical protein [Isosphaeraceae bacterium]
MSYPILIRRTARNEFRQASDWNEGQQPGLGVDFVEKVEAVFSRISSTPELHALVEGDARRACVERDAQDPAVGECDAQGCDVTFDGPGQGA